MTRWSPFVAVVAILMVVPALPAQVEVTEDSPIAWKLAVIDRETTFLERNLLRRYEYTLEQTAKKCQESQRKVADMATKSVKMLEERKGVEETTYRMLQLADESVPPSAAPQKCSGIFAYLVTTIEPN